jgi:site-specific DNA recombinase
MNSKINQRRIAVIYTRVSTDEQKENGFSLQDQLAKLLVECERNNLEAVHYQDEHSAKDFNRPGFKTFLNDVETKKIKPYIFLCVRPDRFSRNLQNTMTMLAKFKSLGIEFKTLENHTDLNSPESLLPFMIYNLMPQIDNERRALNTKRGMRQAKLEGRTMGRPPLGYLNVKNTGTVILDEVNAKLIKKGFEELAKGIYGIEEVRKKLIKEGLKNCCKQSFLNHVRNPYYCGIITVEAWNDQPEEQVLGQHPPLISKALFYQVQEVLFGKRKKTPVILTRREELPLRRFLFCRRCNRKLTGSTSTGGSGKKLPYYHCQKGCKERIPAILGNKLFEDYLDSFSIKGKILELYKSILEDVFSPDENERLKKIKKVDEMIAQINSNLVSLENKFIADAFTYEEYNLIKIRYKEELAECRHKKDELTIDKSLIKKYLEFGMPFLMDMKKHYQCATLETKQKIISSIFPEKLIFSNNKYRTAKTNQLLTLLTFNINELGQKKSGQTNKKIDLSTMAPPLGLEPRTL